MVQTFENMGGKKSEQHPAVTVIRELVCAAGQIGQAEVDGLTNLYINVVKLEFGLIKTPHLQLDWQPLLPGSLPIIANDLQSIFWD